MPRPKPTKPIKRKPASKPKRARATTAVQIGTTSSARNTAAVPIGSGKTYRSSPSSLSSARAREEERLQRIIHAIHEVAVQIKGLGDRLASATPTPLTLESTDDSELLDQISELSDEITRLKAKNEFLTSLIKRRNNP